MSKFPSKFLKYFSLALLIASLGAFLLSGVFGAKPAAAQGSDPKAVNVSEETAALVELLQQSMRAYRLGDFTQAYKLSRAAYLDHFENIELPLRTLDPDLTLDMEYRFAELRTKMQAGADAAAIEEIVRSVRSGVDEIDAMFSNVGALAPALAFTSSFTIIFREGLEVVLLIGALLGYLQTSQGRRGRKHLFLGMGLAIVATLITWAIVRFVISITPVGREVIEAVISIVAVGMLFWVSFWLVSRLDRQHWMEFLRAKSWAAMASGSAIGLIGVGFTALYREGLETALFYEVLLGMSQRVELFVLFGFLVGLGALNIVGYFILRAGRRMPVKAFMTIAVTIIIFLSIAFIGKSVREFQEAGFINATSLIGVFPRLPRVLADFTGIHPTVETLLAQVVLALVYVGGAVGVWLKGRRRYNIPANVSQVVTTQPPIKESKLT